MPIIDEYTRECFRIDVSRSITSKRVIRQLARLFHRHGPPANLRSDNGPKFVADALKRYLAYQDVETRYIEPGAPWQNGYAQGRSTRHSEMSYWPSRTVLDGVGGRGA